MIACNDVDFELADKKKKFGDEPMIGLDPHAIKELKAMIEQMLVFMAMGAAGLCAGSICHKCGSGSFVLWSFTAFSGSLR